MIRNGKAEYDRSRDVISFCKSSGPDNLRGLLSFYPVQDYADCFRSLGVTSRPELENLWSKYYCDDEVSSSVEALLSAEKDYKTFIGELDADCKAFEESSKLPIAEVGNHLQLDTCFIETRSGREVLLALEAHRDVFEKKGCQIVVVASGTREGGQRWLEVYGSQLPLLLDRDLVLYRTVGIRRQLAVAWDLNIFIGYAEAVAKGRTDNIAWDGDDVVVIGGDLLVEASGKLMYSYRSKEQYDRPEMNDLLKLLP